MVNPIELLVSLVIFILLEFIVYPNLLAPFLQLIGFWGVIMEYTLYIGTAVGFCTIIYSIFTSN